MSLAIGIIAILSGFNVFADGSPKHRVALNPLLANVISGNAGNGIEIINNSDNNTVSGNVIGTDLLGRLDLGNGEYGVYILVTSNNNIIGGTTLIAGNLIAYNQKGIVVGDSALDQSVGNSILSNSIYNNTLIGIDLGNDGPTRNHATSPSVGPNDFQNYPVLSSYTVTSSGLNVAWSLNSVPSSTFTLQFFSNSANDPEGRLLVKQISVTTDANGNASNTVSIGAVPVNSAITATATIINSGIPGDTSEFGSLFYGVLVPCPAKPCHK